MKWIMKIIEKLAVIKPREVDDKDFAYEIYSMLLSDCNNHFYCSNLLEAFKVIVIAEQEILASGEYNVDDENLVGFYIINNQEFCLDDLAYELRNVKTNKKILHDTWGPGYQVIA